MKKYFKVFVVVLFIASLTSSCGQDDPFDEFTIESVAADADGSGEGTDTSGNVGNNPPPLVEE